MILWLVAIGVISILGQVVLLRELNVAFYGNELVYVLALGLWMLWTAAGAAVGRRAHVPSGQRVRLLLLAAAWILPLAVVLSRGLRILFGGVPGAYLPFPRQLAGIALALLPVSLMMGLLFQWAAKRYVGERRTLAAAYAIESVGALVGGVLATLFLRWGVQNLAAALVCAAIAVAAACHPWKRNRPGWLAPAVAVTVLALVPAFARNAGIDRALTAWNHPQLLVTRDSPYGRITVTEAAGQFSVFENDALAFESEGTSAEEFAHLAALQRAAPGSVLVLGGGVEGLVAELLRHRPDRIDYVELDRTLLDLLTAHLPEKIAESLEAAPTRVIVADPRRFLHGGRDYDLILVGMPDPESGRTNRYYTREFFESCAERLTGDGVLALRLRGAENLWTPQQTRRAASIHRALRSVFPDVVVLPGTTNTILASRSTLPRDPSVLGRRLTERGVEGRLVIPAYVDYLYTNDRFFEISELLNAADAPVNTDTRPVCYQFTQLIWLSKFFPALALLEMPELTVRAVAARAPFWIALIAGAGALLWLRRRGAVRRALLAGVAGFAGMVLESALILDYQTASGVLFQDLGLLLTLFMGGLAAGAAAVDRWVGSGHATRVMGVGLMIALAALSLLLSLTLRFGAGQGLVMASVMLFACGFLVAALFAYASLHERPDQRATISPLYASDLLGGCLGSLAAALLLIPAAGLAGSALWVAVVAALALLLI
jgi:spermidine synthase